MINKNTAKMKKYKTASALLALVLMFALSACGGKNKAVNDHESPEGVVSAYFGANIEGDIDKILSLMPQKELESFANEQQDSSMDRIKDAFRESHCYLAKEIEDKGLQKSDISFEIGKVMETNADSAKQYYDKHDFGEFQDKKNVEVIIKIQDKTVNVVTSVVQIDNEWCITTGSSDYALFCSSMGK